MDKKQLVEQLMHKVLEQTATEAELGELADLMQADQNGDAVLAVDTFLNAHQQQGNLSSDIDVTKYAAQVLQADEVKDSNKPGKVIPWSRRLAVAAAVASLVTLSIFYWVNNKEHKNPQSAEVTPVVKNDVAAGTDKAILKLANGELIALDSAATGLVASQAGTQILKNSNGGLIYNSGDDPVGEILYNTISIPRGGQYKLTLPDGTKVWLNSATDLRFPVAFTANERVVELSGEAYFEVQKDAAKPFKVKTKETTVQVLGTHFNIMAYADEEEMRTTLLEGRVKVSGTKDSVLLFPGQQAVAIPDHKLQMIKNINTDEAVAWKDGYFQFEKIDQKAMRQIARWYNMDIVYQGALKDNEYFGKIKRSVKLSNMVEALRLMGINCRIEQNKLIVLP